ncbi:MAG: A/G-specific adenine glycosylase, partial [Anaerolineales bacterium]
ANKLLDWYRLNSRRLPWRDHPDPYRIWIAEIMLQQTRVDTVLPYYERWMIRFPTIHALASAPLDAVLSLWEGLGYYQRAQNLHKTAQIIMTHFDGILPDDTKILRDLPGIGKYTAAAIASIAYGRDEPVLDGNARRVLARLFDLRDPVDTSQGEKHLWQIASSHLPPGRAAEYNQAIMDLGATVCLPKHPACPQCPLIEDCQAFVLGTLNQRPVKKPRQSTPHYTVTAAVIQQNGCVLIAQRPSNGLLGSLWEFPGGKVQPGEDLASCLQREIFEELGVTISVGEELGVHRHAYTHFRVTLHAFHCQLVHGKPLNLVHQAIVWVEPEELDNYPMGKIDRQIAKKICT